MVQTRVFRYLKCLHSTWCQQSNSSQAAENLWGLFCALPQSSDSRKFALFVSFAAFSFATPIMLRTESLNSSASSAPSAVKAFGCGYAVCNLCDLFISVSSGFDVSVFICVHQRQDINCFHRRGAHDEALRRGWAWAEGIAGDERERIFWRGRQQADVLRVSYTDEIDCISP